MRGVTPKRALSFVFYRSLLWFYPPSFRHAVGDELQETFRDAYRAAVRRSRWLLVPLWISTVIDLLRSIPPEWLAPRRRFVTQRSTARKVIDMDTLFQDLKFAVRTLMQSPGFTLTVLGTLALGIGANTAIFSLINEVLLRPLPVHDPDNVVRLYTSDYSSGLFGTSSYPDYLAFKENSSTIADLAAFIFAGPVNLGSEDVAVRLNAQMVTGNYFTLLGITPALGRLFVAGDDGVDANATVILSHSVWQSRFGGNENIVGSTVSLNGSPFEVVGVTQPGFSSLQVGVTPDLWVSVSQYATLLPFLANVPVLNSRGGRWLLLVGRLANDVSLVEAQAEVTGIMGQLAQTYPNSNMGTLEAPESPRPVTVMNASNAAVGARTRDNAVGRARLLMAIVGSVLLIACANVANLLLAYSSRRARETALRVAVGATRTRIVRQLMTESVVLGIAGGVAGLGLAVLLTRLLLPMGLPAALQGSLEVTTVSIDVRVLGFTLIASLLTGLLFGVVPALQSSRPNLVPALKAGETVLAGGRGPRYGVRDGLVVLQLAVSLVLLVAAGLFVRSTMAAYRTDLGFTVEGVALASLDLGAQGLEDEEGQAFYSHLLENLRGTPGVISAALATSVPVDASGSRATVQPEGYTPQQSEDMELNFNVVSDGYFETLQIPMLSGRSFNRGDTRTSVPVIIVNETFANRFWPGESPIGKRVFGGVAGPDAPGFEVVGVARNGKYRAVREDPMPYMYFSAAQLYENIMTLSVRSAELAALISSIRATVQGLQPGVPVYDGELLRDHFSDALAQERSTAVMIGALGVLALVLAAVGIYGVVSYAVTLRLQEFGIRAALGARAVDVIGMVLGRGFRLALLGVGIGLALSFALSSLIARFVLDISPTDPTTLIGVVVVMVGVLMGATLLPAWRATRSNPISALRAQ